MLPGGRSGEVRRCRLENDTFIVVRDSSDRSRLDGDPDLIQIEALALRLLADSPVATPRLIAADETSGRLAMTFERGDMVMGATELAPRISTLGLLAAAIRSIDMPDGSSLPTWSSWVPESPTPPAWGDTALWSYAISAYQTLAPASTTGSTLLHRDLHPGNILWNGLEVSAVVDWVNVCVGNPHAELGHCRWNLACLIDDDAPQHFLDSYMNATGDETYDHWWDLSCALSFLPGPVDPTAWNEAGRPDLTPDRIVAATERFLQAALGAL